MTSGGTSSRRRSGPRRGSQKRAPAGPRQQERSDRLRAVIGRLSRRLRGTSAGAGLTPSQASILFTVVRKGPIGLSELAELESINPTMLSA